MRTKRKRTKRETTPSHNPLTPTRAPPLAWAGTSRRQWLPGSPSPLGRISPWKTAQKSVHVGICPLSSLSPSPSLSRALSAGLSIGCSGRRDALASALPRLRTCRPLGAQIALGTLPSAHARSSVCRTLLPVTSRLSLGRVSCFRLCPSAYSRSVWCTCRPPSSPSPPSFPRRFV